MNSQGLGGGGGRQEGAPHQTRCDTVCKRWRPLVGVWPCDVTEGDSSTWIVGGGHRCCILYLAGHLFLELQREPELLRDLGRSVLQGLRANVRSGRQMPSWVKAVQ